LRLSAVNDILFYRPKIPFFIGTFDISAIRHRHAWQFDAMRNNANGAAVNTESACLIAIHGLTPPFCYCGACAHGPV
jgi:hypothetical protein